MCMKRLQILVPETLYEKILKEAKRREMTVAEVVRRGMEKQVEGQVEAEPKPFVITTIDIGEPKVPMERWRDYIYEDPPE